MAKKDQLREIRTGTIINVTSQKQETEIIQALIRVVEYLVRKFNKKVVEEKRYMGMPLVAVDIFKEPEFSSLKLSRILKRKIAEVEVKLGGKIKTKIIDDESRELIKRLTKLGRLALLILTVIFVKLRFASILSLGYIEIL